MPQALAIRLADSLAPLLTAAQKEELAGIEAAFPTQRQLAQELVRLGWVSVFQGNMLLQGKASELILGQYVLLEPIGEGGMGQVYKARQKNLARTVALKVIRKEWLGNRTVVSRFQREIRAAGQLSHPNIVHAFDAGEINGAYFIAMEFIDGVDLIRLIREQGPLPVDQACDFIRQAALGLQHAHECGLVHRDIKPANLLLSRNSDKIRASSGKILRPDLNALAIPRSSPWGTIKLLDLGLARWQDPISGRASTHLTQMGSVMGTPDFIAPEQARNSHTCDIRADLYSLGCTLYYLLAGRIPFVGGSFAEKLLKHQMDEADAIAPVRRVMAQHHVAHKGGETFSLQKLHVPDHIAAIVAKLMAKRPEDRYQTPVELAQALDQALDRLAKEPAPAVAETTVWEALPEAVPVVLEPTAVEAPLVKVPTRFGLEKHLPPSRPRRLLTYAGAALTFALALAGTGRHATHGKSVGGGKDMHASVDATWRELQSQINAKILAPEPLRAKVFEFQKQHPERMAGAAALLRKIASPFDVLDRSRIDPKLWYAWMPDDLVGVLGLPRGGPLGKSLHSVAVSPDGRFIAAGGDEHSFRVWETTGGPVPWRVEAPGFGRITRVAYSPDGALLAASGDDGAARLYDTKNRKLLFTLNKHKRQITCAVFHPKVPLLATAGIDGMVRLWNTNTGTLQSEIQTNTGRVLTLAFHPDGERLFWGGDNHEVHWADLAGNTPPAWSFTGNTAWVNALAFHSDGRTLVTGGGGDGTLRLCTFDGKQVKEKALLRQHTKAVRDAVFSPDGQTLITCGEDAHVVVWDATTGLKKNSYELRVPIHALAFAPDARHFLTVNSGGTIYIFRLPEATELARAK